MLGCQQASGPWVTLSRGWLPPGPGSPDGFLGWWGWRWALGTVEASAAPRGQEAGDGAKMADPRDGGSTRPLAASRLTPWTVWRRHPHSSRCPKLPALTVPLPSLWTHITASTLYAPDKTEAPYPPSDQGPLRGFHGTQHKRFPTGTEGLSQPTCRRIGGRTHIWASSGLWVLLQGRRQCLGLVPGRDPGPG